MKYSKYTPKRAIDAIYHALQKIEQDFWLYVTGLIALSVIFHIIFPGSVIGFQYHEIIPIPDIASQRLLSAATFLSIGAILYKLRLWKVLYLILGWRLFNRVKPRVWVVLMGVTWKVIEQLIILTNWILSIVWYGLYLFGSISTVFGALLAVLLTYFAVHRYLELQQSIIKQPQ